MKNSKLTKLWKIGLAFAISLSTITGLVSINNLLASEDFDIKEIVEVNEENTRATITFDLANIDERYAIESITNPDETTMDMISDPQYIVDENGTYKFKIQYRSTISEENVELHTFEKVVEVNELVALNTTNQTINEGEVNNPTQLNPDKKGGIVPATDILNGDVRVEIPDYSEASGWRTQDAKTLFLYATFKPNSTNKKLEITLPMGMRYVSYRVLDPSNELEIEAEGTLKNVISSVSSPVDKVLESTYGTLAYEFKPGTENVKIELSIKPSETVISKDTTLVDGIVASASEDNRLIGQVKQDIHVKREALQMFTYTLSRYVTAQKDQSIISLPTYSYNSRSGDKGTYYSSMKITYYYPKEFKYDSMFGLPSTASTPVVDEQEGSVSVTWSNIALYNESHAPGIKVKLNGVPAGVYKAEKSPQIEAYDFQGEKIVHYQGPFGQILTTVTVKDKIDNQLNISGINGFFYNAQNDYYSNGPMFNVTNDNVTEKTNQVYEVEIEPTYQVVEVDIPFDTNKKSSIDVYYKTNKNNSKWIKANQSDLTYKNGYRSINHAKLSKKGLMLDSDEYIIGAKGYIGDVPKNANTSYLWTINQCPAVRGRLVDGVNEANVTLRTYAEEAGGKEENSENVVSAKVIRDDTLRTTVNRNIKNTQVAAGETQNQQIRIGGNEIRRFGEHTILYEPTIYLRVPDGITYGNFKVRSLIDERYKNVPYEVSDPYVSTKSNETFVALKVKENFGSSFGLNLDMKELVIDFDISANIQINTQTLNWKDYAFIQDGKVASVSESGGGAANKTPGPMSDVFDVDNDGNISELITQIYIADYKINSRTGLLIDTFIVPKDEERKPPYNGSAETAVAFKPETEAMYNVELFNNTKADLNQIDVYLPVPKEGNDFGEHFQENKFAWNMKLKDAPTIKVFDIDGQDVTSTRKTGYKLEYASDATNESNYTSATYGNSINNQTSMIKITNTQMIPNGERVELEFPYIVDESEASIDLDVAKLGSINDFAPYYYYNATSSVSGYLSGTKVGAILSVGTIEGIVFIDKNGNGIYDGGDETKALSGKVKLLSNGVEVKEASIDANGKYKLTGLDIQNYTLDFSNVITSIQKFSVPSTAENGSKVEHIGAHVGQVKDVNTALVTSKSIYAGIVDYVKPTITSEPTLYYKKGIVQNDLTVLVHAKASSNGFFTNAIQINQNAVDYTKAGEYVVTLKVDDAYGETSTSTLKVNVVDTISAKGFTTSLSAVQNANFVLLANAKAYDVSDPTKKENVVVDLKSEKPKTEGIHDVTFLSQMGDEISVKVFIYTGSITNGEAINATGFTTTLEELKTKDMKELAKAKAYDVSDESNVKEINLTCITPKPTKVGKYTVTFKTDKGLTRDVSMIVSNHSPSDHEVISASNFVIKLSDVNTANFVSLANAKGYNVSNPNDPQSIAVKYVGIKPTVVGIHKARFETDKGTAAEVDVIVTRDEPTEIEKDKMEVVIAQGFEIALKDVASANFITLAKAKAYTYTLHQEDDYQEIPVTLATPKPTTAGIHDVIFKTNRGTSTQVKVVVKGNGVEVNDDLAIYAKGFVLKNANKNINASQAIANAQVKAYVMESGKEITTISVDHEELKAIQNAPKNGGIYDLTFIASENGKQVSIRIKVVVEGMGSEIDTGANDTLALIANSFTIDVSQAKLLNDASAIVYAKAQAYLVQATTSVNISVNPTQLAQIQNTNISGGIYDLTFSAKQEDMDVSKSVKVIVTGTTTPNPKPTPDDDKLAIHAQSFSINYADLATLTKADVIIKAKGQAWLVDAQTKVNVECKDTDFEKLKVANSEGGIYDVTLHATSQGVSVETTIKVSVIGSATPEPKPTPENDKLAISAKGFTLENTDAKNLDATSAIAKAQVQAYLVEANTKVEVKIANQAQLDVIKAVSSDGGIYNLTFSATAQNTTITSTILVVVKGNHVEEKDGIAIMANGFVLTNAEAKGLTPADAIIKANAKAYEVVSGKTLNINNPDVSAIRTVSASGGIYDLTLRAGNISKNVKVVVEGDEIEIVDGVVLQANGFILTNANAKNLDEATAIQNANAKAYGIDGGKVVEIKANTTDLEAITKVGTTGGIFDLRLSANQATKTVKVVVEGSDIAIKDGIVLQASSFNLSSEEANALDETKVKSLAKVKAYTIANGKEVVVGVDATQLAALKAASKAGGKFDLTFSANTVLKTIVANVEVGEIKIVDDFKNVDDTIVIYRTTQTNEGLSFVHELKLLVGNQEMSTTELAKITWKIEAVGGFDPNQTYVSIEDGTKLVKAHKSGVVKLTADYQGAKASIHVVIPGDVNRDGLLNTRDSSNIQKYIRSGDVVDLGVDDKFSIFLANINGDEMSQEELVNTRDSSIIQRMIRNEIPSNQGK